MEGTRASVHVRPSWNNLVDLPLALASLLYNANVLPQEVIVELVHKEKSYVGWLGMTSGAQIGIDPVFASLILLSDKQTVTINIKVQNQKATSVFLEPEHSTDWELVELHAAYIEQKLIEQTRCVATNQILVVYPTKTLSVRLFVRDIGLPTPFALIDPFAEISIAPKARKRAELVKLARLSRLGKNKEEGPVAMKRGISLPNAVLGDGDTDVCVYVNAAELLPLFHREYLLVTLERGKDKKSAVARVVSALLPAETVCVLQRLAVALEAEGQVGYRVTLRPAGKPLAKKLTLFVVSPFVPHKKTDVTVSTAKKEELAQMARRLQRALFELETLLLRGAITNYMLLAPLPGILPHGGVLLFKKTPEAAAWLKPQESLKTRLEFGEDIVRAPPPPPHEAGHVYGIDAKIAEVVDAFAFPNTGVMVHGTLGSGKTLLLRRAARDLEQRGVHVEYVSCESLMNEPADAVVAKATRWVLDCVWHAPSVLVLDNMDAVCPAPAEHGDLGAHLVVEALAALMRAVHAQKGLSVLLLVSGGSRESFHPLVAQFHLVEQYVHMRAPEKNTRAEIVTQRLAALNRRLDFDVLDVVLQTDGYLPNDLIVLCERMLFELLGGAISKEEFERAYAGFTPASLRGVKLETSATGWGDIGGLLEAKRVLLETLEWPTRYAPIFANCPLRLRLGILLYGYPGCGKTLLASAVASQCGLNFILIKGPEILNKYIGASEQLVRELFERAQLAKPCILFFDEFDLIAPKRGHDSTGVTDRVVNQMLTQMDGAEGLDGVYVLAATSRPDLIDLALLRPGRLDKSIICDMPRHSDRVDILRCICSKMDCDGVDIAALAAQTNGYSGADLQALGYNAYLKAVHNTLDGRGPVEAAKTEFVTTENKLRPAARAAVQRQVELLLLRPRAAAAEAPRVVISQAHFEESLAETKPLISAAERSKLDRVYHQFLTGRDGNMPDGAASQDIGGRTTLM